MADDLAIPYGCASVPAGPLAPDVPSLAPGPRPLRLHHGPYRFAEPPDPARLADTAAALDVLREHVQAGLDLWAKHARGFVAQYFAFVLWRIGQDRAAIAARLAPFGGLYRAEDFAFSALRPVPRAHLPLPDGGRARAELAFWTGGGWIAIDIADTTRTRRQRAADAERLAAAGASVVALAPEAFADPARLQAQLPAALTGFWQAEPLPASPFKSARLGDIVDAAAF